jgi:hypothetical protein
LVILYLQQIIYLLVIDFCQYILKQYNRVTQN